MGTAASKKIAKALAATQLLESLPEELKVMTKKNKNKNKAVKRAAALAFTATKQANPATGEAHMLFDMVIFPIILTYRGLKTLDF